MDVGEKPQEEALGRPEQAKVRVPVIEFEGKKLLVSVARGGVTLIDKGGPSQ